MVYARAASPELNLYRTISAVLRDQIEDGVLRPGERLPSEHELCHQFEVSRGTVRQALVALERDGLITRKVGKGTFVCARPADPPFRIRAGMGAQALVALAEEAGDLVRNGAALPSAQVEAILASEDVTPYSIRVRKLGPKFGVKRYLHPKLAAQGEAIFAGDCFDLALADAIGGKPTVGRVWADAVLTEARFALLLTVPAGSPLYSIWWNHRFGGDNIACTQMLVPGDMVSLELMHTKETSGE